MNKKYIFSILLLCCFFPLFAQSWGYESVSRIAHIDNFSPFIGIANEHHTVIAGRIDNPAPNTDDNYIIIDGVEHSNLIEGATLSGNPSFTEDFIYELFLDEHRLVMVGVVGFGTTKIVVYDIPSETIEYVVCINLSSPSGRVQTHLENDFLYIAYNLNSLQQEVTDCTNNAQQTPLTSNDPAVLKFDISSGELLAEIHFDDIAEKSFSSDGNGFFYVAERINPSTNVFQAKVYKLDDDLNIVDESDGIPTNAIDSFFGPRPALEIPLKAVVASDGKTYIGMHAGVRTTVLDENLEEVGVPASAFDDTRYINYETANRGIEFINDSFYFLGVAEEQQILVSSSFEPNNDTDNSWLKKLELTGLQSVGIRTWLSSDISSTDLLERPLWLGMGVVDGKLKLLGYSQQSSALYLNGTELADGNQGSDMTTLYETTIDISSISGTNQGISSFSISDPNGVVNVLDNHNVVYSSVDPSLLSSLTIGRTPHSEVGSFGTGAPPVSPSSSTTHDFSGGNTFYTYALDTSSASADTNFFVGYLESAITGTLSVSGNIKDTFKVFPNPFTETLSVQIDNAQLPIQVKVYDLLGKLLLEPKLVNGSIELSGLKSGVYLLKIRTGTSSETKRVIKR